MQNELDLQREVTQQFSQTSQQAGAHINKKIDEQKAKETAAIKAAEEALANHDMTTYTMKMQEAAEAEQSAANWQRGGVLLNMIASGLAAPTQSGAGIAAATASPALSYGIGQYFKGLAQENQHSGKTQEAELTTGQQTAHILAHAVLGAATSAAGNNNALAGALAAGGAEAAAPVISGWLYGEKDGSKLTAEQKETVSSISNLLGAATGAVVGNSVTDAVQGSLNAQGAVENNYLTSKQLIEIDKVYHECGNDEICKQQVIDYAKILSNSQDARLVLAKIKCVVGFCDERNVLNKEWVHSIGIHNVVRELKKHYPNASHQELMNAAKAYIAEADSSYNQGTTRFITGALNDSPALGLIGKTLATGTRGAVNLVKQQALDKASSPEVTAQVLRHPLLDDAIERSGSSKLPTVYQGNTPTCGHHCSLMVLNQNGKNVDVQKLIQAMPPTKDGITSGQVQSLLKQNGLDALFVQNRNIDDLARYTANKQSVIVRIKQGDFSHFVVVDGITKRNGQNVVAIRDPHGIQYFSPVETFNKNFTREVIIIR